MMTDPQILARFCKCGGDLAGLSRRFHALDGHAKRQVLDLIRDGVDPGKAIRKAKRQSAVGGQQQLALGATA
jgi:hypothetical protein